MDYILAKISNRRIQAIRKLIAAATLYEAAAVTREIEYNFEYKLQDGEWFKIEEFRKKTYFLSLLDPPFMANEYLRISKDEYSSIKWIVGVQNEETEFHFQRVLSANMIEKRSVISLQQDPEIKRHESVLIINQEPDAIYYQKRDLLLFKDLSRVRPIFEGIESLYREATDDEIKEFLSLEIIILGNNFDYSKVSIPNRRRISKALEQYKTFNDKQKESLKVIVDTYCPEIVEKDNYKLASDEDLKKLVYAIEQRYFTTQISNEKKVATSVESVK